MEKVLGDAKAKKCIKLRRICGGLQRETQNQLEKTTWWYLWRQHLEDDEDNMKMCNVERHVVAS